MKHWKWQGVYDTYLAAVQHLTPDSLDQAQVAAAIVRSGWNNDGKTELSQHRTLMNQFRKKLKEDLPEGHVGLDALNFSSEEWTQANRAAIKKVVARNQEQIILSPKTANAIATKAAKLLTSKNWRELAVGIAATTGRRLSEVMMTAGFDVVSPFSLSFEGHVKGQQRTDRLSAYEIPTLCSAKDLIPALYQLRKMQPTQELTIPKCNRFSTPLNETTEAIFGDILPPSQDRNTLSIKSLRAAYAAIATYWYCPPKAADPEFRAHILGHFFQGDDDREMAERRNLNSDRNYLLYAIHQQDGAIRKGIRLGNRNVAVLQDFQPKNDNNTRCNTMKKKRTSIGIWDTDKERLKAIFDHVAPSDPKNPMQWADRMEILLNSIENQLAISTEAPATEGIQEQLTQQSGLLMKLIDTVNNSVGQPELEAQIEQLSLERDEAIAQLQQVRQALGISSAPAPSKAPDTVEKQQPRTEKVKEKVKVKVKVATPSSDDASDIDPDVRRAIQAMIDFNDHTDGFDDKWRISTDPLRYLLTQVGKSSTPKIVAGMKAMKERLDSHHNKHGIGPRHNRKHGGTDKISHLIKLNQ